MTLNKLLAARKGPFLRFPDGSNTIIKGGPGSGHFGHRGDPPNVGGSIPGSLLTSRAISDNFFKSSTWRKLTPNMTPEQRKELEEGFKFANISSNHLHGLNEITTEIDSRIGSMGGQPMDKILGYYIGGDDRSIHLNVPAGGLTPATLIHELGHHIAGEHGRFLPARSYNKLRIVYREMNIVFNNFRGQEGFEAAVQYVNSYGYLPYSMTNFEEFVSDTYKLSMWRRGFLEKGSLEHEPAWVRGLPIQFENILKDTGWPLSTEGSFDTLFDYELKDLPYYKKAPKLPAYLDI